MPAHKTKAALTLDAQRDLFKERGLCIADDEACVQFLRNANYYRLSGYARYFQVDPGHGDNNFRVGTSFDEIRGLYEADHLLRQLVFPALDLAEVSLRTGFAYVFASQEHRVCGALVDEASFKSMGSEKTSLTESVLRDLDRSKEPYVQRYRTLDPATGAKRYDQMPVWVAVEALSFGTLSKCIEYASDGDVPRGVAAHLNLAWDGFTSQVKSLAYLRNRVAHHSRLWNHSVLDAPRVPNNIAGRAKKSYGQYDNRGVFVVLVALDNLLSKAGTQTGFLATIMDAFRGQPDFVQGLMRPCAVSTRRI